MMVLIVAMGIVKKDIVVIVKSVTPARIASNLTGTLAVVPKLSAEDVEKLDGVAAAGKQKRFITPPWGELPHLLLWSRNLLF